MLCKEIFNDEKTVYRGINSFSYPEDNSKFYRCKYIICNLTKLYRFKVLDKEDECNSIFNNKKNHHGVVNLTEDIYNQIIIKKVP